MRTAEAGKRARALARQADQVAKNIERVMRLLHERKDDKIASPNLAGSRGSGHSDPTGTRALRELKASQDRARADLAEIARLIRLLEKSSRSLEGIITAESVTTGKKGALGCRICDTARMDGKAHPEAFQTRYSGELCVWHHRFVERYGIEPAVALTWWHLDHLGQGERIPATMIRDHHPAEYALHHAKPTAFGLAALASDAENLASR